jgi:hypothetical protein
VGRIQVLALPIFFLKGVLTNETKRLLEPNECVVVLVDFQAGLAFGLESTARQILLGNAVALARTALEFNAI